MLLKPVASHLYNRLGWKPGLDLCCNVTGSNSLAPLYYDAGPDALRQCRYIAGKKVLNNPLYDVAGRFIELVEAAFHLDRTTKCLLIVPERPSQAWFRSLIAEESPWRLMAFYPCGSQVFSASLPWDPLSERRSPLRGSVEAVTCWELSADPPNYPVTPYSELPCYRSNVLAPRKDVGIVETPVKDRQDPAPFGLYRDGVEDAQRQQVISKEI